MNDSMELTGLGKVLIFALVITAGMVLATRYDTTNQDIIYVPKLVLIPVPAEPKACPDFI